MMEYDADATVTVEDETEISAIAELLETMVKINEDIVDEDETMNGTKTNKKKPTKIKRTNPFDGTGIGIGLRPRRSRSDVISNLIPERIVPDLVIPYTVYRRRYTLSGSLKAERELILEGVIFDKSGNRHTLKRISDGGDSLTLTVPVEWNWHFDAGLIPFLPICPACGLEQNVMIDDAKTSTIKMVGCISCKQYAWFPHQNMHLIQLLDQFGILVWYRFRPERKLVELNKKSSLELDKDDPDWNTITEEQMKERPLLGVLAERIFTQGTHVSKPVIVSV